MDRFLDGVSLLATLQDIPSIKPISEKALGVYESNDFEMNAQTVRAIEDGMTAVEKVLGKSVMQDSRVYKLRKESYDALEWYKVLQYVLIVKFSTYMMEYPIADNWASEEEYKEFVESGKYPVFNPPVPAIKGSLAWIRQQWKEKGPTEDLIRRFACQMGIDEQFVKSSDEDFDEMYFDIMTDDQISYVGMDNPECIMYPRKTALDWIIDTYSSKDGKEDEDRNVALARWYMMPVNDVNAFAKETNNNLQEMIKRVRQSQ